MIRIEKLVSECVFRIKNNNKEKIAINKISLFMKIKRKRRKEQHFKNNFKDLIEKKKKGKSVKEMKKAGEFLRFNAFFSFSVYFFSVGNEA